MTPGFCSPPLFCAAATYLYIALPRDAGRSSTTDGGTPAGAGRINTDAGRYSSATYKHPASLEPSLQHGDSTCHGPRCWFSSHTIRFDGPAVTFGLFCHTTQPSSPGSAAGPTGARTLLCLLPCRGHFIYRHTGTVTPFRHRAQPTCGACPHCLIILGGALVLGWITPTPTTLRHHTGYLLYYYHCIAPLHGPCPRAGLFWTWFAFVARDWLRLQRTDAHTTVWDTRFTLPRGTHGLHTNTLPHTTHTPPHPTHPVYFPTQPRLVRLRFPPSPIVYCCITTFMHVHHVTLRFAHAQQVRRHGTAADSYYLRFTTTWFGSAAARFHFWFTLPVASRRLPCPLRSHSLPRAAAAPPHVTTPLRDAFAAGRLAALPHTGYTACCRAHRLPLFVRFGSGAFYGRRFTLRLYAIWRTPCVVALRDMTLHLPPPYSPYPTGAVVPRFPTLIPDGGV